MCPNQNEKESQPQRLLLESGTEQQIQLLFSTNSITTARFWEKEPHGSLNPRQENTLFLAAEHHARNSHTQENLFNHFLNLGSAYQSTTWVTHDCGDRRPRKLP